MKEEKNSVFKEYKNQIKDALTELKTRGKRHKQIPNILTVLRLSAPFFIIPAAFSGNIPLAIGLTAGFGLTDFVDGFIARKWELTSELGKNLDAVCDKIFAGTLLIAASFTSPMLLLNLALEGAIAGVNIYKILNGKEVESSKIGKIKTWLLFSLAGLGLITSLLNATTPLNILMGLTTTMQGLTLLSYIFDSNDNHPKLNTNQQDEVKQNVNDELQKELKEPTKDKILEKNHDSKNNISNIYIQELTELKEKLLSSKPQIYNNNDNKVMKKNLIPTKVTKDK